MTILDKKIGGFRVRVRLTRLFYVLAGAAVIFGVWSGVVYLTVRVARLAWGN